MKSAQTLVEDAMARVSTLDLQQAQALWSHENVQFVDLRELGELQRDGIIPGAFHAAPGGLCGPPAEACDDRACAWMRASPAMHFAGKMCDVFKRSRPNLPVAMCRLSPQPERGL